MEKAQLYKSAYNNQLQQSIYLCYKRKILQVRVTMAWSKVKSRSHHDAAHLHPPTNVLTKYLPTRYQLPTL